MFSAAQREGEREREREKLLRLFEQFSPIYR